MPVTLSNVFGIHEKALRLRSQNAEILANNLANANTPGFKAREVDFAAALGQENSAQSIQLAATHQGHIATNTQSTGIAPVRERESSQGTLDGNSVDPHKEQIAFSENYVRYQASLKFINQQIHGLSAAIKGE